MFISQGFHATTVESIAQACGLTKGAVYFHFQDKAALLIALLDRIDDQIYTPLLEESVTGTQSPPRKLLRYLYKISAVGGADIESVVLPVVISVEFKNAESDAIGERVSLLYDKIRAALNVIISQGRRSGDFIADIRSAEQVSAILAMHDGVAIEWMRSRGSVSGRGLVHAFSRMCLRGILSDPTVCDALLEETFGRSGGDKPDTENMGG